ILSDVHIYQIFEIFINQGISLIPVTDYNSKFIGSVSIYDLTKHFATFSGLHFQGAVIVISTSIKDYTLSHIAQIIESNGYKIMSMYIYNNPENSSQINITIKLNTHEIDSILATFERHNYIVKSYLTKETNLDNFYKSRVEGLLHYLNL
ncbi:MAG: CBS domain-containing protein, partial [Bacteroidales bacterium]